MINYEIEKLDIKKIADSGQTFRMRLLEDESAAAGTDIYECVARDKICKAGDGKILCNEKDEEFWREYFDIDTDYEAIIDSIDEDDTYLCAAAEYGRGIRILKQDAWEMLITFIISQRRSIPSIKTCVEALCRRFGKQIRKGEDALYAFPTPSELACTSFEELSACGLGYRTEYVYLASRCVCDGNFNLEALNDLGDEALMEALLSLKGVGVKVANCVSLFGYHRIGAFPIDVWIERVLKEHYPLGFPFERYEGYAGVLQQYMFYAARK